MRSDAPRRPFRDPLPRAAVDVVVIGAGSSACSPRCTFGGREVRAGVRKAASPGQSSRNWGWVRCMNRDPAELPLAMEAQRQWRDIDAEMGGAAGFRQSGIAYLCATEEKMQQWEFWLDVAEAHGLDSHFLSSGQVCDLVPSLTGKRYAGALYTPTDGRAEPWRAVPAVAQLAHAEGVQICEQCAVRGIDIEGGAVRGVITENGRWLPSKSCSLAALGHRCLRDGMASTYPSCSSAAPLLLQRSCRVVCGQIKDENIAVRRREDGGYTLALANTTHYFGPDSLRHAVEYLPLLSTLPDVSLRPPPSFHHPNSWSMKEAMSSWEDDGPSPFEKTRVLDPPPDTTTVERLRALFAERFPEWNKSGCYSNGDGLPPIAHAWAGMIDAMPDVVPV